MDYDKVRMNWQEANEAMEQMKIEQEKDRLRTVFDGQRPFFQALHTVQTERIVAQLQETVEGLRQELRQSVEQSKAQIIEAVLQRFDQLEKNAEDRREKAKKEKAQQKQRNKEFNEQRLKQQQEEKKQKQEQKQQQQQEKEANEKAQKMERERAREREQREREQREREEREREERQREEQDRQRGRGRDRRRGQDRSEQGERERQHDRDRDHADVVDRNLDTAMVELDNGSEAEAIPDNMSKLGMSPIMEEGKVSTAEKKAESRAAMGTAKEHRRRPKPQARRDIMRHPPVHRNTLRMTKTLTS